MTTSRDWTADELITWFDSEAAGIVEAAEAAAKLPFYSEQAALEARDGDYFTETATGVQFAPDTPLPVWARYLRRLGGDDTARRWRIGDALLFGEVTYGEMAAQEFDEDGGAEGWLSYSSLTKCRYVARAVAPCRRRQELPWSWHAEVAALDDTDQEVVLELAEVNKAAGEWARPDLRAHVREIRNLPEPTPRLTLTNGDIPTIAGELRDRLGIHRAVAVAREVLARYAASAEEQEAA